MATGQRSVVSGQLSGLLVVDKPKGPTSHDVVQKVRKLLNTKVGHTGTLDPLATGVLPLLLGQATRLARFFQGNDKEYEAQIKLGKTTRTYDEEGEVIEEKPAPKISSVEARQILAQFTGTIQQLAPLYSAVKVGGHKLYQLARRRSPAVSEDARPSRTVSIYRIDLVEQGRDLWTLHLHCSAGTYIRSLAHEIGQAIGCGAYLQNLRRCRSGAFQISDAITLQDLPSKWQEVLLPVEALLPELPRIDLSHVQAARIIHGTPVLGPAGPAQECRLFYNGKLVALATYKDKALHPTLVLACENSRKQNFV